MADNPNQTQTAPSNSILDRILGRMPSDPEFDKRMTMAKAKMQQEMPNEMANASIEPTGFFGGMKDALVKKAIGGTPVATTGPFGGITYNQEQLAGMSQNELEDTLAHELTHVGQYSQQNPGGKPTLSFGHGMMNVLHNVMPKRDEGLPQATKSFYSSRGYDPAYRGSAVEMEAYQKEDERKMNRGDILRPGEDIFLPSSKKTKFNTAPTQLPPGVR